MSLTPPLTTRVRELVCVLDVQSRVGAGFEPGTSDSAVRHSYNSTRGYIMFGLYITAVLVLHRPEEYRYAAGEMVVTASFVRGEQRYLLLALKSGLSLHSTIKAGTYVLCFTEEASAFFGCFCKYPSKSRTSQC